MAMSGTHQRLDYNIKMLRSSCSKHAIYGLGISIIAIFTATIMVCFQDAGTVTLAGVIRAHENNVAIWMLDFSPFLFVV